jgi:L-aspartate oxidase
MKTTAMETDYVVVGCGIAGLRAAIELAAAGRVVVLSKAELTESATQYAQGGIAAALSDEDEVGLHLQDTLKAGDGLCNEAAVKVMVEEGPRYIQELIDWERRSTARARSWLSLARAPTAARGAPRPRRLHRARDCACFRACPHAEANRNPAVCVHHRRAGGERPRGRSEHPDERGGRHAIRARRAAGERRLGQVYSETTNPSVATGDGVAIAYRAGAAARHGVHPVPPHGALSSGAPRFLLSEALRGEGGCLRNVDLERFMPHYHEAGDLAPRDIVSRAIVREKERTGADFVYLDMTKLDAERVRTRFPRIHQTCLEYNLDITTDLIPVRPAAHYSMGGVATDLEGRTMLAGLYAAGEVACNGVHGANRLASNSLLDGRVFGARAGQAIVRECPPAKAEGKSKAHNAVSSATAASEQVSDEVKRRIDEIRTEMWKHAGIIRKAETMRKALERLEHGAASLSSHPGRWEYEEQNMRTVGEVIVRCALAREESRGGHYRSDFAFEREELAGKHSRLVRGGEVAFE